MSVAKCEKLWHKYKYLGHSKDNIYFNGFLAGLNPLTMNLHLENAEIRMN
jgi:hypothetical protein